MTTAVNINAARAWEVYVGCNDPANLRLACDSCNASKGQNIPTPVWIANRQALALLQGGSQVSEPTRYLRRLGLLRGGWRVQGQVPADGSRVALEGREAHAASAIIDAVDGWLLRGQALSDLLLAEAGFFGRDNGNPTDKRYTPRIAAIRPRITANPQG